jgi:murein DD-endopeptidase MepM/ murein hydrolase activator NlpD
MQFQSVLMYYLCMLRVSIADMVSLNVRTKGLKNSELPTALYQGMPEMAMALIATIPCGTFAVSIPGENGLRRGYPILKEAPPSAEGFVVVYRRMLNGRYEAAAVQYQGREFEIEEFIAFAHRWVERNTGMPKAIPGCYAYLAPAREEWGVILRDSGYLAWDASEMPLEITPCLRARRQSSESSGIIARIPVYAGEKRQSEEVLPVFSRAEVELNINSGPQSDWISFAEYQRIRADRARLPDSIVPGFHEWLSLLTEESGFKCWIFLPGMLFGSRIEWWGDRCRRRTEHEGLDFATGILNNGDICSIPEGAPVRALADGEVAAVLDDFIRKTVAVRHSAIRRGNGDIFHTLLSHIQPQVRLLETVAKGQIIGRVGKSAKAGAPAHLHLSGAWIPRSIAAHEIRMEHMHPAFEPVALANFNDYLQDNPLCFLKTPKMVPGLSDRPQDCD